MQPIYPTPWTLGKPRGTIKGQPTCWLVVMSPPNAPQTATYFRFKDYNNNKESHIVKLKSLNMQNLLDVD